jgi:CBS domain-containing protein
MNTRLSVAETMDREPLILSGDEPVAGAARAMRERGVGSFLVYRDGNLAGIVTERDLVHKVVAESRDPAETTVSDIMTIEPITIDVNDDILHALRIMREYHIRRLPVVEDGALVGLITERAISEVAPELIQIADDWRTITAEHEGNGYRPILDEEAATVDRCEICGNVTDDVVEIDGDLLCEDCRENFAATGEEPAETAPVS